MSRNNSRDIQETLGAVLKRAGTGDSKAEEQALVYLRVRFQVITKRIVWGPEAEDIVQDACLTILEKIRAGVDPDHAEAWARGILRNKIGNFLQKRGTQRKHRANPDFPEATALAIDEPRSELLNRLRDCLRRLIGTHRRYARVLNLAHQGYNTPEICARLRIKPGNLYVMLNRARSMLDGCLKNGTMP